MYRLNAAQWKLHCVVQQIKRKLFSERVILDSFNKSFPFCYTRAIRKKIVFSSNDLQMSKKNWLKNI